MHKQGTIIGKATIGSRFRIVLTGRGSTIGNSQVQWCSHRGIDPPAPSLIGLPMCPHELCNFDKRTDVGQVDTVAVSFRSSSYASNVVGSKAIFRDDRRYVNVPSIVYSPFKRCCLLS